MQKVLESARSSSPNPLGDSGNFLTGSRTAQVQKALRRPVLALKPIANLRRPSQQSLQSNSPRQYVNDGTIRRLTSNKWAVRKQAFAGGKQDSSRLLKQIRKQIIFSAACRQNQMNATITTPEIYGMKIPKAGEGMHNIVVDMEYIPFHDVCYIVLEHDKAIHEWLIESAISIVDYELTQCTTIALKELLPEFQAKAKTILGPVRRPGQPGAAAHRPRHYTRPGGVASASAAPGRSPGGSVTARSRTGSAPGAETSGHRGGCHGHAPARAAAWPGRGAHRGGGARRRGRGVFTLTEATLVTDHWGADRYAAVNGVFNAPLTAAGAIAPSIGAAIAAATGSYPVLFVILAAAAAAGAALAAAAPARWPGAGRVMRQAKARGIHPNGGGRLSPVPLDARPGLALPARSHLCSLFIDSILTELS